MQDAFLVAGGGLGMLVAVIHGYLGETRVVRPAQGVSASAKRIMQAIMFLSAVYWFVGGAVLAAGPAFMTASDRRAAVIFVGAMFLSGAAANFWATRGRHPGWMLMSIATALAWLGA